MGRPFHSVISAPTSMPARAAGVPGSTFVTNTRPSLNSVNTSPKLPP